MRLSQLSYFVFEVNAALDTGKYDHLTIADVQQRIENKEVVPWLRSTMGDDIDLSLIDASMANELHNALLDICDANKGRESKKWGLRKRGLCLLIAWTVEMIQHRQWSEVRS